MPKQMINVKIVIALELCRKMVRIPPIMNGMDAQRTELQCAIEESPMTGDILRMGNRSLE